ncbi:arrestin domain-containing protein 2-like [Oscarella lobularis]|uniref:arrestin domain-containing protein 2-like n=1 Tax=Oscarella lobularis TaxID=121494 RepID=UPI003313E273
MKQFFVTFTNNQNAFYPGQTISGTVVLELDEPTTARGVRLILQGRAHVHWSEQHGSGQHRHTVHYSDSEVYMNHSLTLWGKQEGDRQGDNPELPLGMHTFPFSFVLPSALPSSFESYNGHIRYYVTAQVDRPWKFDYKSKRPFTVIEYVDVNQPALLVPMRSENDKHLCCLCCKSGPIKLSASIDRSAYCPGESVVVSANAENLTNREMRGIRAQLIAVKTLYARGHRHCTRHVVCEMMGEPIAPQGFGNWSEQAMPLPPTAPSIKSCRILDLSHYIQVCIVIPRGINLKIHFPILLGSIPLRPQLQRQQSAPTYIDNSRMGAEALPPPAAMLPASANPIVPTAPPTYAEATDETFNIADQDDTNTFGNLQYAPAYPFAGVAPPPAAAAAAPYPPAAAAPYPPPAASDGGAPYPPSGGYVGAPYPPAQAGGGEIPLQPMPQDLPTKSPIS